MPHGSDRTAMEYRLSFRTEAQADLDHLYDFLADLGGREVAARFVERIISRCYEITSFPGRGQPRDDLSKGIRTMPFRRRALIAYRIVHDEVVIVRIFYAGRDYESELADD